ncbi:MAG: hypothetical protein AAF611_11420 [Bacteroidota bacterium]
MSRQLLCILTFVFSMTVGNTQSNIDSLQTVLAKTSDATQKLNVLDVLTNTLVQNNSDEQETYLKQYISLANELQEYDLMAAKARFLIQYYIYSNKNQMAQQLCDSLLGLKSKFKKESSEAHLLLKRAATFYNEEKLNAALLDYDKASELFLKGKDSIFAADALFFGGQVAADANDFMKAIRKYKQASKLYDLLGDNQYAILAGAELTALYSNNGFVKKSIQERARLIQKATANKDYFSLAQLTGQNINAYYKLQDYDQMLSTIDALLQLKDSIDGNFEKNYYDLFALNYKLLHFSQKSDIQRAKPLITELLKKTEKDQVSQYLQTDILLAKAAYYELINDQSALIPILENLAEIKTTNRFSAQVEARDRLATIYKKKGQILKSLELKEINTQIKDSIYNAQKTNAFLYYQSEFEAEQKQRELMEQDAQIQKLAAEKELAATKRNYLITGIVIFFLLLSAFIYVRNRQKIKEQAYKNILLNNKIATKTEEINELLTETIQHIKSKERIAENLEKLSDDKKDINLKSIIADLKASKADNAKLMLIKQNIEQVNFEFIKTLKTEHPKLTKTDVEICSLIRIGLSRKEVANLRNTSLEAVKMSRSRIKKKLELSAGQSLDNYINSL